MVDPTKVYLPRFHEWYKPLVPIFIESASEDCQRRITLAIEHEESVRRDDVEYSTSVRDSSDILLRLFNVRDDLQWPDTKEKLEFTQLIMEKVTAGALFYVKHAAERMSDDLIYDEKGRFRATSKVRHLLFTDIRIKSMHPAIVTSANCFITCNLLGIRLAW